ncbi:MAG: hypothetical protein AABY58_07370 [Nitrospirota bacterium]
MKNNLKKFRPFGPFEIKFENMPGGKRITRDLLKNFWTTTHELNNKIRPVKGVYIFGMKVTSTILPCYIGKTNNTFERECFTDRNINIYNGEIIRYARNYKPFIFFLVYQQERKQKISDKVLRELERYLINLAVEKNSDLANTRGREDKDRFDIIEIGGRGRGRGAPTKEGKFYKKMMD